MTSGEIPRGSSPPTRIVFPDGTESPIKHWRDLLLAVVGWSPPKFSSRVPVTGKRTRRPVVAKDPAGMHAPKAVGPYGVETHFSAHGIVRVARYVLSVVGEDPNAVRIALK